MLGRGSQSRAWATWEHWSYSLGLMVPVATMWYEVQMVHLPGSLVVWKSEVNLPSRECFSPSQACDFMLSLPQPREMGIIVPISQMKLDAQKVNILCPMEDRSRM